jgi:cobalt/nickel transport system ATP-binding protein
MPTVFDDVIFGPLNLGMPEKEASECALNALKTVGLVHLKDRHPYHLSGGEKRRVAIATVLSMFPNVLALDEPSAGLDPKARRKLIALLQSFNHTKIIASHDLDMVAETCSRTIVLYKGRIKADGPTGEIFRNSSLLESCFLEQPLSMLNCPVCGNLCQG